ncbi:hypothetical protein NQZ68_024638 [Dissostichus eleginoides]|nr:hypothetical protein NQZ68_024638 [Dissostichus eleginoides]
MDERVGEISLEACNRKVSDGALCAHQFNSTRSQGRKSFEEVPQSLKTGAASFPVICYHVSYRLNFSSSYVLHIAHGHKLNLTAIMKIVFHSSGREPGNNEVLAIILAAVFTCIDLWDQEPIRGLHPHDDPVWCQKRQDVSGEFTEELFTRPSPPPPSTGKTPFTTAAVFGGGTGQDGCKRTGVA